MFVTLCFIWSFSLFFVPLQHSFVWDGIFIGTTRSRGMLVSCFWAAVACFVLWFMLSPLMGNHALWLALLDYLAHRG